VKDASRMPDKITKTGQRLEGALRIENLDKTKGFSNG